MQDFYDCGIHKVQDYIDKNYGKNITADKMAEIAGFSRFHFSRIFKAVLNESPMQYVNRIRLEHSLFLLSHRKDMNMTDVALELGFSDSAVFTRAFKKYFNISPSMYRKQKSTNCKEDYFISTYNEPDKTKKWTENTLSGAQSVRLERISEFEVVYVRHTGDYVSLARSYRKLMNTLFTEAKKQGLLKPGENHFIAIYHDNPEFGTKNQFRTSLCLTIPSDCRSKETEQLGKMEIEGGLYMIGHFEINANQFEDAWDYMYQQWIIAKKHMPRNSYPFEVYLNNPNDEKDHLIKVDIYVPLEE
ncbi:MAG: GyrI-like domain-containing protein [Clostridiales bacterium]|nr:GyrI-like domain-containing protein [Clostridiales bacterium]